MDDLALFKQASELHASRRYLEAVPILEDLLTRDIGRQLVPNVLIGGSYVLAAAQFVDKTKALAILNKGLAILNNAMKGGDGNAFIFMGMLYEGRGDYRDAEMVYRFVKEVDKGVGKRLLTGLQAKTGKKSVLF